MYFIGNDRLFVLLDRFFGSDFDTLTQGFQVIGVLLVILDTTELIVVMLRSEDTWRTMKRTYYDIVQDRQGLQDFEDSIRIPLNSSRVLLATALVNALTLPSLIFTVLMAVLGVMSVGMAYGIGELCSSIVGSLEGICFRFTWFGMEEIQCGEDFHVFCNGTRMNGKVLLLLLFRKIHLRWSFTTIRHPMRCHGTFDGLNQVAIPGIQDLNGMQGLQVSQTLHIARLHGSTSRSGLVAVVVRSGLDVQFHQGQVHGVRLQSHEDQGMSLKCFLHDGEWTKDGQGHDVDRGILPGMPQGQMTILSARPRNGGWNGLRSNGLGNVPGKLRLVHRSSVFV